MYEVEVKVPASLSPVRERLRARDGTQEATVEQVDTYYDAPDRDFAETDEALRIREVRKGDTADPETRLTYKGPLVDADSKTREEAETAVEDPAALRSILDGLGYQPAATVRKEREHWQLDDYTVTLDDVEGLGTYVEVETETADDVEAARAGAFEVLRSLELDPDDQIRTSYLGLLLETDSSE